MEIVNHIFIRKKRSALDRNECRFTNPKGTIIPVLKATSDGTFYLFSNKGVYKSVDGGSNWTSLDIPWENRFMEQHPYEMLIIK